MDKGSALSHLPSPWGQIRFFTWMRRPLLMAIIVCTAIVSFLRREPEVVPPPTGRLHLLVPATRANIYLCKLLLSGYAMNYPNPILINWIDGDIPDNDRHMHLAKVQGVDDYLARLQQAGGHGDDLVLIVDGYDMWFQLGADVLLKRYFDTLRQLDQEARRTFGRSDIRHTVVFGAEKVCWPDPPGYATCWTAPKPQLNPAIFGPHTHLSLQSSKEDITYSLPRWLNSGTIMGPVDDLRRVYNATLEHIRADQSKKHSHAWSDQAHFSAVRAAQEMSRLNQHPDLSEELFNETIKLGPEGEERETHPAEPAELRIGIDYFANLFQAVGCYISWLVWVRNSDTKSTASILPDEQTLQNYYHQEIPRDILESEPPFARLPDSASHQLGWSDVRLLYNTATRTIPAVIHVTNKKQLRESWWPNMWFQHEAKALRQARVRGKTNPQPISSDRIGGKVWYPGDHLQTLVSEANLGEGLHGAGAWSDQAKWISWEDSCHAYEPQLFDIPD